MARKLPHKDVVIVGLGWTGAILAHELASQGLDVVALERGPWRNTGTDFSPATAADELRNGVNFDIFQSPAQMTYTFRHNGKETALPMRKFGAFVPGNGLGGAGVHWNGMTYRLQEHDFNWRSHLEQRYGAKFLPEDMTSADWPLSYQELEPFYDYFEKICGISGRAGNLQGQLQAGGNRFEGPRRYEYPNAPNFLPLAPTLFGKGAAAIGMNPFPIPTANVSRAYVNPLGVRMGQCTYCGFCDFFACANYSKASAQTTIMPVLMRLPNFEARMNMNVLKVNLDSTGKKATGVTYIDSNGVTFEQGADLVLLCAFALNNVHLMLVSGIGMPFDPETGKGVIGRNFAYQSTSACVVDLADKTLNPFIAGGAIGMAAFDYNSDNFDHSNLGFVGGGVLQACQTGGKPLTQTHLMPGDKKWGSGWKKAMQQNYQHLYGLGTQGAVQSYRDVYLDLDPTYKDPYGRPLLRLTYDWHPNEVKMSYYITDKLAEIGKAMGASRISVMPRDGSFSTIPYQSTHTTGGTIAGTDPSTSAVNKYMQSWDVPNVFVFGANAFPQNVGFNPTGTVGALAYWGAAAIKNQYLKAPGQLIAN